MTKNKDYDESHAVKDTDPETNEKTGDKAQKELEDAQGSPDDIEGAVHSFETRMAQLSNAEKGSWGEQAVDHEARESNHMVLLEHPEETNRQGFDLVSWDETAQRLHIWEAKNFHENTVSSDKLTAWSTENVEHNRWRWNDILGEVKDEDLKQNIMTAVNEGRTSFHLRIGPETQITRDLKSQLDNISLPWCDYDWKRYSAAEMMSLLSD